MYRTLTDSKLFGGLPHRRICLNNIIGNLHCPLFNIILQREIPRQYRFYNVCGRLLIILSKLVRMQRIFIYDHRNTATSGTVTSVRIVVIMTPLAQMLLSIPILSGAITAIFPTGMAIITAVTPRMTGSREIK